MSKRKTVNRGFNANANDTNNFFKGLAIRFPIGCLSLAKEILTSYDDKHNTDEHKWAINTIFEVSKKHPSLALAILVDILKYSPLLPDRDFASSVIQYDLVLSHKEASCLLKQAINNTYEQWRREYMYSLLINIGHDFLEPERKELGLGEYKRKDNDFSKGSHYCF